MARKPENDPVMMSVSKEMAQMGMQHPNELITAILDDHESSRPNPKIGLPTKSHHPSTRTVSLPALEDSNRHGESEAEMMSLVGRRLNRSRSDSEPVLVLNQSHWKPTTAASKCAGPSCRKRFASVLDRRRNCCMCGKVFCRRCTNYRRNLSVNAKPDPFGTCYHVCQACFNYNPVFGGYKDLMREFSTNRRGCIDAKKSNSDAEVKKPICVQKSSVEKRAEMKKEMLKLAKGFEENSGWMKGILAELKVPAWQKLPQWVETSEASHCSHCNNPFRAMSRKLNCRVGGQVFCSSCCKDEIVIFSNEGEIKWAVNGKPGGPISTPSRYKLMPVCSQCSGDLQIALQENLNNQPPPTSSFLERLHRMHQDLSKLEAKIETSLPDYQKIVDTLDMADSSPQAVQGRHPLQVLVKVQSDLSDAFSALAVESQKLKVLKPETCTESRLHRHAMIGTYQYYSENMFQFRLAKNRLSDLMPTDHLQEIQQAVSQQSMERVHIIVQQLMYEALNLEKHYKFESDFFMHLMEIVQNIEAEFQPFLEQCKESWEKHSKVLMEYVQIEIKEGRTFLNLTKSFEKSAVRYVVISQCSSLVHECYRELQAKTIDREFRKTKESLLVACSELDSVLIRINAV